MEDSDKEFLRALHEEKIRTQNERADYVTRKLAFITVLFGISSVDLGFKIPYIYWLLYFVPMVAISFDLYIMSADSRIKRIGVFLGRHPVSMAGKAERQWERFCVTYRDGLAPSANMFFSAVVTLAAAVFIYSQPIELMGYLRLVFAGWLTLSLALIIGLWIRHEELIKKLAHYEPLKTDPLPR
jgi:hypothetical protein